MMGIPLPAVINDCFLLGSFQEQAEPVSIRSSVDAGIPKVRRRYTGVFYQVTGAINCTHDELIIFQDFVNVDLQGGVLRFDFQNPTTGEYQEFRFKSPFVVSDITEKQWLVTMELERFT